MKTEVNMTLHYEDLDSYKHLQLTHEIDKISEVKRLTYTAMIYEDKVINWFTVWKYDGEAIEVINVHDTLKEAIETYNKI
jgi:hypothetical protein